MRSTEQQSSDKGEVMEIRHIGFLSLCAAKHSNSNITRIDLGAKRYKQLGVKERLKDEKPYRVCKRCIAKVRL